MRAAQSVSEAHDASHQSRRRRTLGRRDSDEKTARQIQLHFSHLSPQEVATVRVNGETINDRVNRNRRELHRDGGA